jgi:3-hydroxypropanoate dehydrogenase
MTTLDRPRQAEDAAIDLIFTGARTAYAWRPTPVNREELEAIYDLSKLGPTSLNCCPGRFVFLTTPQSKERLVPALNPGNVDKTRAAPVTVIVAYDSQFHEQLPKLMPYGDLRSRFVGQDALIAETAFRNGSLQGAYLIIAARALGLDCGPMSGFDAQAVNAEFFPDGGWKANFLINLGHRDSSATIPRMPRLAFEEACRVL